LNKAIDLTSFIRAIEATLLATGVFACAVAAAPGATPVQALPITPPSAEFQGLPLGVPFNRLQVTSTDVLVMRAGYSIRDRRIELSTRYSSSALPDGIESDHSEAVRYWPTCIGVIDNTTLCVAGKGPRTGNTILELWHFGQPVADLQASHPIVVPGKLESIDTIYDADVAGRRYAQRIEPILRGSGSPISALVQYNDSHELYQVSLLDGSQVKIVSATAQAGMIQCPFVPDISFIESGNFKNSKYVYLLTANETMTAPLRIMALYDNDKDGTIDSSAVLTLQDFMNLGYNDGANWIK
jgi:hypothetical protein